MRIGSSSADDTRTAGASAPRGEAGSTDASSTESGRSAPARSGALAQLSARRTASATASSQAVSDPKGKRPLAPSPAAGPAPAAKRLRPAGAEPGARLRNEEPRGEPGSAGERATGQSARTLARPPKGSRQSTTADMVYRILVERSRGASTSEIAGAVSVADGTIGRWINAKRWQSGEVQATLAKMSDYAQHRDAIDALVKTMGLTSEDLPPPPARSRGQMTADLLKQALELMLAKRGEGLVGRGRTPGILSAVAGVIGMDRKMLVGWLNADGTPAKPLDAVARLPGYEQVRGDLQALFSRHGHQAVADGLRAPGEDTTHKMTAALLVDILQNIKADRAGSSRAIGGALGVQPSLVRVYVALEDASLRSLDVVRKMPDYAQHRESLAAALAALGNQEQARGLPLPLVDAEYLLNALRDDMPRFVGAMKAMQAHPKLPPFDAAKQAGLLPEAFTAVIGAGGVLRERGDVYATLARVGRHLVPGLDEELARLRATALGKAPVAAAPREMARFELPARGTIPAKVFIVRPSTGDPGPKAKNRLEKIYANNADLVRPPRSYETERPRQMLRWLSTVLKDRFPDTSEVQCYYHVPTRQIVVASNHNEVNTKLAEFFAEGGARQLIDVAEPQSDAREARHSGKLRIALAGAADSAVGDGALQKQVRAAIAAGRFVVPHASVSDRGKTVRLHAERRILNYVRETFGEALDRRLLAGTMRPCGTCADELGLGDEERRGPFWLSHAAQALSDTPRIIERNIDKGIGTYVTKTRAGRVTTDHDTDSDSDIEDTEVRMKLGRGRGRA